MRITTSKVLRLTVGSNTSRFDRTSIYISLACVYLFLSTLRFYAVFRKPFFRDT